MKGSSPLGPILNNTEKGGSGMADIDAVNATRTLVRQGFNGVPDDLLNDFIREAIKAKKDSYNLEDVARVLAVYNKDLDDCVGEAHLECRTISVCATLFSSIINTLKDLELEISAIRCLD